MLDNSNFPSWWQSLVMDLSPSKTWINTVGWLSWAVEKVCDFLVGMTVLRPISLVSTPPTVSIPRVKGVTSRRRRSAVSLPPSPDTANATHVCQISGKDDESQKKKHMPQKKNDSHEN